MDEGIMEGEEQNMDFSGRSLHPLSGTHGAKATKTPCSGKLELVQDPRNAGAAAESFLKTTSTELRSALCAAQHCLVIQPKI